MAIWSNANLSWCHLQSWNNDTVRIVLVGHRWSLGQVRLHCLYSLDGHECRCILMYMYVSVGIALYWFDIAEMQRTLDNDLYIIYMFIAFNTSYCLWSIVFRDVSLWEKLSAVIHCNIRELTKPNPGQTQQCWNYNHWLSLCNIQWLQGWPWMTFTSPYEFKLL